MISNEFIELRSEEVQEILTRVPSWLVRWGTVVIFFIVGILFSGAWLIHFPDLLKASFKLSSTNAPKAVFTRSEGRISRLFVQDGTVVSSGDKLAYIESTAIHDEVIRLSKELDKARRLISDDNLEAIESIDLKNYHHLGELQIEFQTFEQTYIQLRAYLKNGFYSRKKSILEQELVDLKDLYNNLKEQQVIQEKDMQIAQEDYEIQQKLANQKAIAPLELKREESKNLAKKMPYQLTISALINNLSSQRNKLKEILELDKQVSEQRDNFTQALNTLQSATEAWKSKYIVTSPEQGKVYFSSAVQQNQHLSSGQELLFVVPDKMEYYGELRVPQFNSGKVKNNQEVLIKFSGYPFQEYGVVKGIISNIAQVSLRDSVFLAKVHLPLGLRTTYGKELNYRIGMSASAEIITDDSRIIDKLFFNLRKLSSGR